MDKSWLKEMFVQSGQRGRWTFIFCWVGVAYAGIVIGLCFGK